MIDLKENEHLYRALEAIFGDMSYSVDRVMNENKRQWGYPEAVLITTILVAIYNEMKQIREKLNSTEPDYKTIVEKVFVKPRMRAKDIAAALPEGISIKQLLDKGYIRKVNPFVYERAGM